MIDNSFFKIILSSIIHSRFLNHTRSTWRSGGILELVLCFIHAVSAEPGVKLSTHLLCLLHPEEAPRDNVGHSNVDLAVLGCCYVGEGEIVLQSLVERRGIYFGQIFLFPYLPHGILHWLQGLTTSKTTSQIFFSVLILTWRILPNLNDNLKSLKKTYYLNFKHKNIIYVPIQLI